MQGFYTWCSALSLAITPGTNNEVVLATGDFLYAFDSSTGKLLWKWGMSREEEADGCTVTCTFHPHPFYFSPFILSKFCLIFLSILFTIFFETNFLVSGNPLFFEVFVQISMFVSPHLFFSTAFPAYPPITTVDGTILFCGYCGNLSTIFAVDLSSGNTLAEYVFDFTFFFFLLRTINRYVSNGNGGWSNGAYAPYVLDSTGKLWTGIDLGLGGELSEFRLH
jgi:hypothetical protein